MRLEDIERNRQRIAFIRETIAKKMGMDGYSDLSVEND